MPLNPQRFVLRPYIWLSLALTTMTGMPGSIEPEPVAHALPANPTIITTQSLTEIPFKVCGESPNWKRPSPTAQLNQLKQIPRYAADLDNPPLQNAFQQFWTHNVFTFTQYGLSLRVEPVYLSGLWTTQDTLWKCYDADRANQINAGKLAEVWVLSHRVTHVRWTGDRYVMVVQPAASGVQFVQFPRREAQSSLPLKVITEKGTAVTVVKGG